MNKYETPEPIDSGMDLSGAQAREFLAGENRSGLVIMLKVIKAIGKWEGAYHSRMFLFSLDTEWMCRAPLWCPGPLIVKGLSILKNAFCCPMNCTGRYLSPLEMWSGSPLSLPEAEPTGDTVASDSSHS